MPTHRCGKGALLQRSLLILRGIGVISKCWAVLYFYENPPVPILKH